MLWEKVESNNTNNNNTNCNKNKYNNTNTAKKFFENEKQEADPKRGECDVFFDKSKPEEGIDNMALTEELRDKIAKKVEDILGWKIDTSTRWNKIIYYFYDFNKKHGNKTTKAYLDFLEEAISNNSGFNSRLVNVSFFARYEEQFLAEEIEGEGEKEFIAPMWKQLGFANNQDYINSLKEENYAPMPKHLGVQRNGLS